MSVQRCNKNWKPWYKQWDEGFCYTYTSWDKNLRDRAKKQAEEQGRVIEWNRWKYFLNIILKIKERFNK